LKQEKRKREEREGKRRYHFGLLLSLDFLGSLLYLSLEVGTATVGVHLVLTVLLLTLGERQPKVRNRQNRSKLNQ
jgi:hypothetical protein